MIEIANIKPALKTSWSNLGASYLQRKEFRINARLAGRQSSEINQVTQLPKNKEIIDQHQKIWGQMA